MKSLLFFIVLMILVSLSLTLIYYMIHKYIPNKDLNQMNHAIENYADFVPTNNQAAIEAIATHLGISSSRIYNYREIGDSSDANNFYIEFEIRPRSVIQPNDPPLAGLPGKIDEFKRTVEPFNIRTVDGKNMYFINIQYTQLDNTILSDINPISAPTQNVSKFVNPAWNGSIKYLSDKQKGFADDPELDPTYSIEKGQVIMKNRMIPTVPTPSGSPNSTSSPQSSSQNSLNSSRYGYSSNYQPHTSAFSYLPGTMDESDQTSTRTLLDEGVNQEDTTDASLIEENQQQQTASQQQQQQANPDDTGVTESFRSYIY
jgi:hypothetical protein